MSWLLRAALTYVFRLHPRHGWSRARLLQFQQEALRALVRRARARSPFYRRLYHGIDPDRLSPADLPPVEKRTLMAHFDEAVTDPRLTMERVRRHLAEAVPADLYQRSYVVLATSGSSGIRGYFPYSVPALATVLAAGARVIAGHPARWQAPPWRSVMLGGTSPAHGTYRMAVLTSSRLYRNQPIPADTPLPELVQRLNRVQPHSLTGFPSLLLLLAHEQVAGRLQISPSALGYGGETAPPGLADAIRHAWPGAAAVESYALTELGIAGGRCARCGLIHLYDDLGIFEVVDAQNRPVPPGGTGRKLLLTNLFNPVLPLIRYEVTDLLTLAPGANPCGLPWTSLTAVDGRSDEVLWLPGRNGENLPVMPNAFRFCLGSMAEVREYQVIGRADELLVRVVLQDGVPETACAGVRQRLAERLEQLGVLPPAIRVEAVAALPRAAGKLKLILSEAATGPHLPEPPPHPRPPS